jgi:hypothetical protein
LRERTKEFGLGIIRMFGTLPKSAEAQVLGKQVLRSGTSIGANYREAYRGRSRPEFIAKCGDCLREIEEWSELGSRDMDGQTCDGSGRADGRSASQTAYRLELLVDSGIVSAAKLSSLRREVDELAAIFVTILKSSRDRS